VAKIESFEDLVAWQKARALCREIHSVTKAGAFGADVDLKPQIRRAAVSVVSNIAEGFERGRKTEFAQYCGIAKGSSGEVRAQLYVALDEGYLDEEDFMDLNLAATEVGRILAGLRQSLLR
jgi:four helix bundle protein